jgi:hypothetical protein
MLVAGSASGAHPKFLAVGAGALLPPGHLHVKFYGIARRRRTGFMAVIFLASLH